MSHVTQPTSAATSAAQFLINKDILYEICCFGMNDIEPKVSWGPSVKYSLMIYSYLTL